MMICPYCEQRLMEEVLYCEECGHTEDLDDEPWWTDIPVLTLMLLAGIGVLTIAGWIWNW